MVSNVIGMEQDQLVRVLQSLRTSHGDEPEYQKLRAELPEEWPI